ncbi:hypothetical protein BJV74DRAFT_266905 [Russula compacta]|nr:hypothetical protein BJV74DRAFT_266905 [Russula compacta]
MALRYRGGGLPNDIKFHKSPTTKYTAWNYSTVVASWDCLFSIRFNSITLDLDPLSVSAEIPCFAVLEFWKNDDQSYSVLFPVRIYMYTYIPANDRLTLCLLTRYRDRAPASQTMRFSLYSYIHSQHIQFVSTCYPGVCIDFSGTAPARALFTDRCPCNVSP